jgi:2-(1,2-epoxy-1,2-dihydrophenyl)acetyl-CoA isomerase
MGSVQVRRDGPVAVLELDRPEALNAFDRETIDALGDALDGCRDDAAVRVVVLTGRGRAFCAGGDIGGFASSLDGDPAGYVRELAMAMHRRLVLPIRQLPKPVIASINGTAAGGGLSLALACDLRIAAEEARLTMAYAAIGLSADGGSSYTLPRLVGWARAAELLLFADSIDGRRAAELGLVHRAVPATELAADTGRWAARLAERPATALAEVKRLLTASGGAGLEEQLTSEVASMARLAAGADYREGVSAFMAKRPPRFNAADSGG